ncbi:hypothetical protein LR48_Vigan05g044500 [Vigna angularis]|uniref:Uncharacterized protein n=1 Tax=Phaseolus angularis TaxID=3914 RepID=A0A0L9UJG9_PHAAN|nr:hypothetical protein LR48_Vigan05g044500 [Vigna angularis]
MNKVVVIDLSLLDQNWRKREKRSLRESENPRVRVRLPPTSHKCRRSPSSSTQPASFNSGSPQLRCWQTKRRRHRLPSAQPTKGAFNLDSSHPLPSLCRSLAVAAGVSSDPFKEEQQQVREKYVCDWILDVDNVRRDEVLQD